MDLSPFRSARGTVPCERDSQSESATFEPLLAAGLDLTATGGG